MYMNYISLAPSDVAKKIADRSDIVLLDVRTDAEHERMHILGDVHIALNELEDRYDELPKKTIIAYCASGNRSRIACDFLSEKGYDCINLSGGIGAWCMSGYETV